MLHWRRETTKVMVGNHQPVRAGPRLEVPNHPGAAGHGSHEYTLAASWLADYQKDAFGHVQPSDCAWMREYPLKRSVMGHGYQVLAFLTGGKIQIS